MGQEYLSGNSRGHKGKALEAGRNDVDLSGPGGPQKIHTSTVDRHRLVQHISKLPSDWKSPLSASACAGSNTTTSNAASLGNGSLTAHYHQPFLGLDLYQRPYWSLPFVRVQIYYISFRHRFSMTRPCCTFDTHIRSSHLSALCAGFGFEDELHAQDNCQGPENLSALCAGFGSSSRSCHSLAGGEPRAPVPVSFIGLYSLPLVFTTSKPVEKLVPRFALEQLSLPVFDRPLASGSRLSPSMKMLCLDDVPSELVAVFLERASSRSTSSAKIFIDAAFSTGDGLGLAV